MWCSANHTTICSNYFKTKIITPIPTHYQYTPSPVPRDRGGTDQRSDDPYQQTNKSMKSTTHHNSNRSQTEVKPKSEPKQPKPKSNRGQNLGQTAVKT